jgi:tRNA 2-thiouridine synthesizing protein A
VNAPGRDAADTPALVLDCRGQRCPLPILILARRIGEVEVGEVVQIEADDPAAAGDIAAWCRMRAQTFLGVHTEGDGTDSDTAFDATPRYRVRRRR